MYIQKNEDGNIIGVSIHPISIGETVIDKDTKGKPFGWEVLKEEDQDNLDAFLGS